MKRNKESKITVPFFCHVIMGFSVIGLSIASIIFTINVMHELESAMARRVYLSSSLITGYAIYSIVITVEFVGEIVYEYLQKCWTKKHNKNGN